MHVSTAFNNLDREELDEVIYKSSIDTVKLIELIDCLDDGLVRAITKELVNLNPLCCLFNLIINHCNLVCYY